MVEFTDLIEITGVRVSPKLACACGKPLQACDLSDHKGTLRFHCSRCHSELIAIDYEVE